MKKVLIISRYFAPANEIGAIRCTKLAKYLSQQHNCQVTVLTQEDDFTVHDPLLAKDAETVHEILRVPKGRLERWFEKATARRAARRAIVKGGAPSAMPPPASSGGMITQVLNELNFIQVWLKSREYARSAWRLIAPRVQEFDAIISSYSPISEHLIGLRCKRRHPKAVWIADYRDSPWSRIKKMLTERVQATVNTRAVLRRANYVTVISDGIAQDMGISGNSRVRLVYNGFDREDLVGVIPRSIDGFSLAYLGGFYGVHRDLRPVFRALRTLADSGQIDVEKLHIVYAGSQFDYMSVYAQEYHLEDLLIDLGLVDRAASLAIQMGIQALLLPSYNETGATRGIMTGKFLEYMMINRPIIGIINGNLSNSLIKRHIEEGRLGFCYEQADEPESFEALKAFLLEQYRAVQQTGKPLHHPDDSYIEQFSYPAIAAQFAQLLEEGGRLP